MKRGSLVIAVIVLLAAAGAGYVWWKDPFASPPSYRLAKIERGPITAAVSATGTLNPVVSVQVGSQVSGQIKELYVDFNSPVKKNQLIARIDPQSFQLRVNQAMADLEAARANALTTRSNVAALQAEVARAKVLAGDAEREYNRNQMLFEKTFVSAAARDKALAMLEASREQLKAAQAQLAVGQSQVRNADAIVRQRESQLSQAKVDLDRTEIKAPVDGIVVKKSVEPGQTVAASLQAPELFVIAQDLKQMQVDASIDESEVGRIRVGQEATFTVDAFPGRTFRGEVKQVRRAAQVVQNVVTYVAVIATSNPDLGLFPGMTANVRVIIARRDNVLKVPNAALRFRPAGASDASSAAPKGERGGGDVDGGEAKGKGKGRGGQAMLERLTKELELTADQRARVEAIFAENRAKIGEISPEDPAERRRQVERLRAEARQRVTEILTAEQRVKYEAMGGGRARGATVTSGRVWVPDDAALRPKAIPVRVGLTDGTFTELVSGDLQEGDQVILGMQSDGGKAARPAKSQTKGPRFGF
ncbi:MAG TPA: efflux RND transporter periplasmic adaptor subunit [Burkholderiales bacterium]|nr:efflux RND transporter periplasmic adaptor subunit [Burkholderiales bacterium]